MAVGKKVSSSQLWNWLNALRTCSNDYYRQMIKWEKRFNQIKSKWYIKWIFENMIHLSWAKLCARLVYKKDKIRYTNDDSNTDDDRILLIYDALNLKRMHTFQYWIRGWGKNKNKRQVCKCEYRKHKKKIGVHTLNQWSVRVCVWFVCFVMDLHPQEATFSQVVPQIEVITNNDNRVELCLMIDNLRLLWNAHAHTHTH